MTVTDTDLESIEEHLAEQMRLTHIVVSADNPHIDTKGTMTGLEVVYLARAKGIEVVALCGYRFVPVHNPEKYDTCDMCLEEAHRRMENG